MDKVGISSPWMTFARKVNAMFENDPEINVQYDEEANVIKLFVDNSAKADALSQILPAEKEFGNVKIGIEIVPANEDSPAALFRTAFAGNPVVDGIEVVPFAENAPVSYVVFARQVVSFFNDDMSDYFGAESTLYEDLARDVFDTGLGQGVCFCTNIQDSQKEGLQHPLGEWP